MRGWIMVICAGWIVVVSVAAHAGTPSYANCKKDCNHAYYDCSHGNPYKEEKKRAAREKVCANEHTACFQRCRGPRDAL